MEFEVGAKSAAVLLKVPEGTVAAEVETSLTIAGECEAALDAAADPLRFELED